MTACVDVTRKIELPWIIGSVFIDKVQFLRGLGLNSRDMKPVSARASAALFPDS